MREREGGRKRGSVCVCVMCRKHGSTCVARICVVVQEYFQPYFHTCAGIMVYFLHV